ncbi:MAG: ribbon-helix-helix protein, CopG family [Dermatophilaceae bacterium]|jgi:RHH-type rel operon transcriptional repressor/antitoxin RelB|nr:ribbon-helix-helix protein, CopG family [Actinomycetales bacterium]MBP8880057.1 ribbon-helix-helix protein, CopG family [Dermatophilaceae bacterium]MBP9918590.1 ribbon-helix-helix protein, CopG family [Dermatophilaceae bacterium]
MTTSVRIPAELQGRIDALAERTHRSRAFYLREAIERGLPQVEWEYDLAQRAVDVRSGKVTTVPLAEVVAELGLDD